MTELLPPDPDVSGWHFLSVPSPTGTRVIAREWAPLNRCWRAGLSLLVPPSEAHELGHHYLRPIPSADRLAAMERIVALCAAALAEQDTRFPGTTADDGVIWKPHPSITAGMIRCATGEKT